MNTIGSLLVHVDASPRSDVRLALAQWLAVHCDTGSPAPGAIEVVYCTAPSFTDMPLAFAEGAAGAMAFLADLYERRHAEVRQRFETINASAARPMRWREIGSEPIIPAVVGRALYADLLLLGQHMPDEMDTLSTPTGFVESVLIESGKPAIIVPFAGTFAQVGKHVLIAWKPSREAARAVAAALPLLQRSSRIHVAVEAGNDTASQDLETWLRTHGVEAKLEHHAALDSGHAGEGLLSLAADVDADLLVMGCYGHSRARELVLGGATRTVLRSMTLPVLMAH